MNREEFLSAIKLASVFGQKNNELKIAVHPNKKAIEVASADQAFGENTYLLPAKIKGPAAETFFNVHYLSDAVRSIVGDDIFWGFKRKQIPRSLNQPQTNPICMF